MAGDDGDSPEAWIAKAKRGGAIRLLAIGGALLVAGSVWAAIYWNHGVDASPITYVRVVAVLVLAIGAGLAIAGGVGLARKR